VPVLVTDEGEAINESQRIVEWAESHPATSPPSAA
jgi:glutathione S-transferase